jgi:sec-independent protein translocase protein TatC
MSQNPLPDEDDVRLGLETKPFLAHLEDLRWTIIRCVGALAISVTVCAFSAKYILDALYVPYRQAGQDPEKLFNFGVVDPFSIHMEISIFGGIILALPLLLYFIGQFLLPALTLREKRFLAPIFAAGGLLFLVGTTFCYTFVLRATLKFFIGYSSYLGFTTMWTAKGLVDFEVQMLLGFGIAFEMPLVILVLNLLGIISAQQMAAKRRHAATDLFSLSLLSVPMYLLYEACIWIAFFFERKRASTNLNA